MYMAVAGTILFSFLALPPLILMMLAVPVPVHYPNIFENLSVSSFLKSYKPTIFSCLCHFPCCRWFASQLYAPFSCWPWLLWRRFATKPYLAHNRSSIASTLKWRDKNGTGKKVLMINQTYLWYTLWKGEIHQLSDICKNGKFFKPFMHTWDHISSSMKFIVEVNSLSASAYARNPNMTD